MIDLETIEREINEIVARRDTTYSVCERLAWLYVVADHLKGDNNPSIDSAGGSDFLRIVSGKPIHDVLSVIDEHLEALRVVQPRAYDAVMQRLDDI